MCEREDSRASQGGDGRVGTVSSQEALHVLRIEIKVEVFRDLKKVVEGNSWKFLPNVIRPPHTHLHSTPALKALQLETSQFAR